MATGLCPVRTAVAGSGGGRRGELALATTVRVGKAPAAGAGGGRTTVGLMGAAGAAALTVGGDASSCAKEGPLRKLGTSRGSTTSEARWFAEEWGAPCVEPGGIPPGAPGPTTPDWETTRRAALMPEFGWRLGSGLGVIAPLNAIGSVPEGASEVRFLRKSFMGELPARGGPDSYLPIAPKAGERVLRARIPYNRNSAHRVRPSREAGGGLRFWVGEACPGNQGPGSCWLVSRRGAPQPNICSWRLRRTALGVNRGNMDEVLAILLGSAPTR